MQFSGDPVSGVANDACMMRIMICSCYRERSDTSLSIFLVAPVTENPQRTIAIACGTVALLVQPKPRVDGTKAIV
jgi:hypothetical protein